MSDSREAYRRHISRAETLRAIVRDGRPWMSHGHVKNVRDRARRAHRTAVRHFTGGGA